MADAPELLVVGRTGQLARAIRGLRPDATYLSREALDLRWPRERLEAAFQDALRSSDCRVVINAAAYTAVDQAETDEKTAQAVNADAPGALARLCRERGLPFIHISTDYVFSGDADRPWRPDDETAPLNIYGRTKRDGERAVLDAGGTVLRTSWVYDAQGRNFLTTMVRLAETQDSVRVVNDQIGRPTYAPDLAEAVLRVAEHPVPGVFHVTGSGDPVSWAGFAEAIFEANGARTLVEPIPTADYPTPASRPLYSVMDMDTFERAFGHVMPDWRDGLVRALRQTG